MYFKANFNAANELAEIAPLVVTPGDRNRTLTVEASGTIATTFLQLAGDAWRTLPIAATATARRTTLGLELALVLDVTGSMAGNSIVQLRAAATDLINILFGTEKTLDTLYVAVVPYVAAINYGSNRGDWLQGGRVDQGKYAPQTWRGCVEARTAPDDETDATPAQRPFKPFLYPSTSGVYQPKGDNDWDAARPPTDPGTTVPAQSFTGANKSTGPNIGCGQPVAGLDNDRDRLLAIIAALRTSARGGTMAPVGLQAGWNTLSPKWRGLWGTNPWGSTTPAGLPVDYDTPFMQKVIVMITDGTNEWFNWEGDAATPGPFPPDSDYTAYGRRSDNRLGATTAAAATAEINRRMLRMCTGIKANKIVIYTITVDTGGSLSAATKSLYRQCASQPDFYFDAPNAGQLRAVFTQIGSQLSNLRLER